LTVDAGVSQGASRVAFTPDGRFAYVTGHNPVSVFDTATGAVVDTIPIRDGPVETAMSPDGSRVYLSLYNSKALKVVDTASNSVTATFEPGGDGMGGELAVAPDGQSVYLCRWDGLRVLDATTGAVRATVPAGSEPHNVVVSSDGQRAYVTTYTDTAQIAVIDLASGAVTASIPGGGLFADLAISPDNRFVYVTNGDGTLGMIDTESLSVIDTVTITAYVADHADDYGGFGVSDSSLMAFGVAVTPDGSHVYVSTETGVSVVEVQGG